MAPGMQHAFKLARRAASLGEVPIGAAVTWHGSIISGGHNEIEASCQVTNHAEILALRRASNALKTKFLAECTLWVTLEPCPMCASAIAHARVGKLVFGASDPKSGGVLFGPQIFDQPTCHHVPEIRSGVGATESERLLKNFFKDFR